MTQRNYMNQRYRDEERTGKTRKSAASAKPATRAGASVRTAAEKTPRERRREQRQKQREREAEMEQVPIEYTEQESFWRKVWWGLLVGSLVALIVSWAASALSPAHAMQVTVGAMIAAYGCLFMMIFVDIKFVRPARKRAREKAARGLTKKEKRELAERRAAEAAYRAAHPTAGDKLRARFARKPKEAPVKGDGDEAGDKDGAGSAAGTQAADGATSSAKKPGKGKKRR